MKKALIAIATMLALGAAPSAMAEEIQATDSKVTLEAVDFKDFADVLMGSEEEAIKYATGENQISYWGTAKAELTFADETDFLTITEDTYAGIPMVKPVQQGNLAFFLNPDGIKKTTKNAKPKFEGTVDGAFMIRDAEEAGLKLEIGVPEVVGTTEGREDLGLKSAKDYEIEIKEKTRTPIYLVYEKTWGEEKELDYFYINKKNTFECIVDDDRTIEEEFMPVGVIAFDDVVPTGHKVIAGTWEKEEGSDGYVRTDVIRFPKAMTALVAVTETVDGTTKIYSLANSNKIEITNTSTSENTELAYKVDAVAKSDAVLHEEVELKEELTWEECFEEVNGFNTQDALEMLFAAYGIDYDPNAKVEENAKEEAEDTIYTEKVIVQQVQEALNAAGYDCGVADGIAGAKTIAAMNAYQKAKGLTVRSEITSELLIALGIQQ